ncbi:hypothetical protein [Brachyspira hyodysenteriae]|uniref:hypothetical protein n=1 Tax=Brachyspira hyodysenteriae TaxID=159 RepID=UPI0022CD4A8D|nr:hypothetical protein [Brachyspira hyodysenteriae]MCZ9850203.1 hypothetical protein [Brachyspira hyodysenteriae]MCZ9878173.1 hypothetical protein [Brachyspira hyodysenteriae]MCZ9889679.1 hypothetical protein [Brachyspira hyodysenteriae]MCZ9894621.1 hypothetical protein [Brachyspira hyodysenteriae]MCZ9898333.1 hypothetical protein [Brachyspira hyodysenteriae]
MKNLIFALFLWIFFLLAINALQNDSAKKRISELEKRAAHYEYQIFQLRKEIIYLKNPYLEEL